MNLINPVSELILLYKSMPTPKKASKYDLMLTPQFYITKDETLPIKYSFQAKKIAPSILDELLEDNKDYEFIVEKLKDNRWRFYAYSPKEIEEFLKTKFNINSKQIKNIYFTEQIKDILAKVPINLDDNHALVLLDSKSTIIPKTMLESEAFAKFNSKMRPKKSFSFKRRIDASKNIENKMDKSYLIISILLILISITFFIEGLSYKKAQKELENSLISLYEKAPQLRSKLIRKSIKNKYLSIENRQRAIREQLKNFSQLSSKKSILENLTLNKNNIEATFKVEPSEIKKIKSITTNTELIYKDLGNGLIQIRGNLK